MLQIVENFSSVFAEYYCMFQITYNIPAPPRPNTTQSMQRTPCHGMKTQVVKISFQIFCSGLFLYYFYTFIVTYLKYDTVTKTSQDKQENHPRPLICLSTKNLLRVDQLHEEYHDGNWLLSMTNVSAEEVYDLVSPRLSDLISSIKLQATLYSLGDEYKYVEIDANNETDLIINGLVLSRCDYYEYLKCYCISLDPRTYPHGVQGVFLYPMIDIRAFVVAPGRFYDFSRKLTTIEIETNFSYEYVIDYSIYNLINLETKPCKASLSWREDECKLSQLTGLVTAQYNCTSPWFLYFARLDLLSRPSDQFLPRARADSVTVCGPDYSRAVSSAYYRFRYRSYHQCENPCSKMGVNTFFIFKSSTPGTQMIRFTFIREIQVTEEKLKVEIETMIANIGGYLGMILGTFLWNNFTVN